MYEPDEVMTFREYIHMMAGSGVVYESECREAIESWKNADWIKVDEIIAPIVAEVLTDAAETNRPLYEAIMKIVMDAYVQLNKDIGYKPDRPTLTRIK